ncbi:hypothetical protein [Psychroflexus lacisalsi]|jgi:hypothetical protein|nr:hypothetical protein [Psychroflexus lacisalsi]MBZ9620237.1 hypothetical protein [Psychroflexus lacisalsi]
MLGIVIFIAAFTVHYFFENSAISFFLGISTAIGILLVVYGRLNIFRRK